MPSARVRLRERTEADLDACVEIARVTHKVDGYPVYLPSDLRTFIGSPAALGAWVAERDGEVIGQVVLNQRSTSEVMALACRTTNRAANECGVVARLFVSPRARREGVGRLLLQRASGEAVHRGLWPLLDVVTSHQAAIKLYEASGWVRAGRVTSRLDDGTSLDEFVYVPSHLM